MRFRSTPSLVLMVLVTVAATLTSCQEETPQPNTPLLLQHDFGTVRHGHIVDHDFEVPLPAFDQEIVPKQWIGQCVCITGLLMIQDKNGWNRPLAAGGQDRSIYRVLPGEKLILRLTFDTNHKEATDLKHRKDGGRIQFEPLVGAPLPVPPVEVVFHFGIHAPIKISPLARMDFGRLPVSKPAKQVFELHPNLEGFDIKLGKVETTPHVEATLDTSRTPPQLTVEVHPEQKLLLSAVGRGAAPFLGAVRIATNIPGQNKNDPPYTLLLPVSGEITQNIEVLGRGRFQFGFFDFQTSKSTFVVIADHHPSAGKLVVQSLRDTNGNDIRAHFDIATEYRAGSQLRIDLKYLGKLRSRQFRGELSLGRSIKGAPICRIRLSGHNAKP